MKANAPEKIYISVIPSEFGGNKTITCDKDFPNAVEYIRTDAFIEKAAHFLCDYNQKQVLKHGARATLGCGEYTINVDDFRKYME